MSNTLSNDDMKEAINHLLVQQITFNAAQFERHTENEQFSAEQHGEAGKLACGQLAREPAWHHIFLVISAFGVGAALARFFF